MALLALPAVLPLFRIAHFSLTQRPRSWGDSASFRGNYSRILHSSAGIELDVFYDYAGDDADLRFAIFTDQSYGSRLNPYKSIIVLAEGKSCAIEDVQSLAERLARLGHVVVCFDFRSQGMSARVCHNPQKIHVHDFTEYGHDLLKAIQVARGRYKGLPVHLVAMSMGGAVALDSLLAGRLTNSQGDLIDDLTLMVPLIRAHDLQPNGIVHSIALQTATMWPRAYLVGRDWQAEREIARLPGNRLTSDHDAALEYIRRRIAEPNIIADDITAQWAVSAINAGDRILAAMPNGLAHVQRLRRVRGIIAAHEQIVCNQTTLDLFAQIPKIEIYALNAMHGLIVHGEEIEKQTAALIDGQPVNTGVDVNTLTHHQPPGEISMIIDRLGYHFSPWPYKSQPARLTA